MTALPGALRLPDRLVLPARLHRRATLLALAGLVLLAGALRLAAAAGPHGPLSADEGAYLGLARDVAGDAPYGSGMTRPFHWPPGAPAVLGAALWLDPGEGVFGAYVLQALLGTLLVLVVFALGALVAGRVAGLAAAAFVAVYPPLVGLGGSLLSEPLGMLLLATATLVTVHAALRSAARWPWAGAGALWGLTVLTRADFLFAPLLVAAVLVFAGRRQGDRALLRGALAVVVAAVVTVAPWSAYASDRAGTFVPVTTGGGAALFVGTYLPGGGTTLGAKRDLAPVIAAGDERWRDVPASRIPAPVMLDAVAERHPGLGRDAAVGREARYNVARYPLGDPVAYGQMTLDKLRRMWLQPSRIGSAGEASAILRLLHPVLVLSAFALALLALWRTRSGALALLLAPVAYGVALHAVVVANPRYALVLLPLLAVAGVAGARFAAPVKRTAAV
jgi:4-amino-4-deoxy-L-arabinose transferase-like glycosyltransferase